MAAASPSTKTSEPRPRIYTVGHSTRSREELIKILKEAGIEAVADVRSFPTSRRYPHFNGEALAQWLPEAGIDYVHIPELGGRREPGRDSSNGAWRERGFRGYADHMRSPQFARGIERLQTCARARPTAIMCAEALWWRCHRRLIADWLTLHGWEAWHLGSGAPTKHELTPFAQVGEEGMLQYPPAQVSLEI